MPTQILFVLYPISGKGVDEVVKEAQAKGFTSDEHFTVDGLP
jgi:hypothetical protein